MPTNILEETDYAAGAGALSGERVFKNADPATTFREQSGNSIWHNLRTLIREMQVSGDLTQVSYAADLAAGFPNISKAIRRAARRLRAAESVTVLATNAGSTFTLTSDVFAYFLNNDGGGPYGDGSAMYPDTTNPGMNNYRLILVLNASGEEKLVGDSSSGKVVKLRDKESCYFYGIPNGGATYWIAVGKGLFTPISTGTIPVKIFNTANGAQASSAQDLVYRHDTEKKLVTVSIPGMGLTMTTGGGYGVNLLQSDGSLMPVGVRALFSDTNSRFYPAKGLLNGATTMQLGLTFPTSEGGAMQINRMDGVAFSGGDGFTLYGSEFTFFCR